MQKCEHCRQALSLRRQKQGIKVHSGCFEEFAGYPETIAGLWLFRDFGREVAEIRAVEEVRP